jgi:biopolymer transport protein ExbB
MLSHLFLGLSLLGAEWVLYLLLLLSVISVAVMFERARFYRQACNGLADFRSRLRSSANGHKWSEAKQLAEKRSQGQAGIAPDLEAEMAFALIHHFEIDKTRGSADVMTEVASDAVMRARLQWERNLSVLATIGSNAPFIGLFGTVLGIIKAFHDLSHQIGGAQTVTAGISEALVATAIGLFVAIPAVVSFNFFQRRVKAGLTEAESLKAFLIGKMAE